MIKEIVKDTNILSKNSEPFKFGVDDPQLFQDMLDTANAHNKACVGLAAVQIGVHKRVILAEINGKFVFLVNPIIVKYYPEKYRSRESCISLEGVRNTVRYRSVYVIFRGLDGEKRYSVFNGRDAQIIQHEIDHLDGVLI